MYGSPEQAETQISQLRLDYPSSLSENPAGIAVASSCPSTLVSKFPREASIYFQSFGNHRDDNYICFVFLAGDALPRFAAQLEQILEETPDDLRASMYQVRAVVDSAVHSQDCLVLRHMI
jgi:hypothetical protein